jgi:hypothetical protein
MLSHQNYCTVDAHFHASVILNRTGETISDITLYCRSLDEFLVEVHELFDRVYWENKTLIEKECDGRTCAKFTRHFGLDNTNDCFDVVARS